MQEIGECVLEGMRPRVMVYTPESEVVRVTPVRNGGHIVRVRTGEDFMRAVEETEAKLMKEWHGMEECALKGGIPELSIYMPASTRLYDKTSGEWVETTCPQVGAKLSFAVFLRERGHHTVTDAHQVCVYDCFGMVGNMAQITASGT